MVAKSGVFQPVHLAPPHLTKLPPIKDNFLRRGSTFHPPDSSVGKPLKQGCPCRSVDQLSIVPLLFQACFSSHPYLSREANSAKANSAKGRLAIEQGHHLWSVLFPLFVPGLFCSHPYLCTTSHKYQHNTHQTKPTQLLPSTRRPQEIYSGEQVPGLRPGVSGGCHGRG